MPDAEPQSLHTLIGALEHDSTLHVPERLRERLDALDRIELLQLASGATASPALQRRTVEVQQHFAALNADAYARMRDAIRRGTPPPLLTSCLADTHPEGGDAYDWRDELIEGVLQLAPPAPVATLPADMVAYQPTPARHIFDLLAQARLRADDVLVDLGSGLGHVPLLTAICSGAAAVGIEREASHVACARAAAESLRLPRVRFDCMDARAADVSVGTLFYLYTPFRGAVLQTVLDALRREAGRRPLRLAAHGPCVAALAAQPWLVADSPPRADRITLLRPRA
ncbi:putative protein OS=Rhodanobacter lindaniclasticus OX=75310 GN=B1991_00345 PE=4 SV=1 [Rhodanobacter lindaniclasticus]